MSGDWIKMRGDLFSDPEVVMASRLCNVPRDTIVGRLHRTWAWADKVTVDGFVPGMTGADLDMILNIRGWSKALQTVGWLEVTEDGLRFPRFDRHNGKSAKRRAMETDRKQNERRRVSAICPQSVRIESGQSADQRREEKRRDTPSLRSGVSPDVAEAASPGTPAISWNHDQAFDGITDSDRANWLAAYPSVNIDGEIAKAHAWLVANPKSAGKRNWRRFLTNWLARTHERGGKVHGFNGTPQTGSNAAAERRAAQRSAEFPDSNLSLPVFDPRAGGVSLAS